MHHRVNLELMVAKGSPRVERDQRIGSQSVLCPSSLSFMVKKKKNSLSHSDMAWRFWVRFIWSIHHEVPAGFRIRSSKVWAMGNGCLICGQSMRTIWGRVCFFVLIQSHGNFGPNQPVQISALSVLKLQTSKDQNTDSLWNTRWLGQRKLHARTHWQINSNVVLHQAKWEKSNTNHLLRDRYSTFYGGGLVLHKHRSELPNWE